jgi:hypothetical protein
VFWSFGWLVEYLTCVNTVSNITVLYDHWKHIRFPHILVLFCCCHLQLRLFLYVQLRFRVPHHVSYIFIYFISCTSIIIHYIRQISEGSEFAEYTDA